MLARRLLTAALGIPLLLLVLWAGHPWLGVLVALVALLAAVEMGELLRGAGYAPAHGVLAVFAVASVAVAALVVPAGHWLMVGWLALLVPVGFAGALGGGDGAQVTRAWLATLAGAVWVSMLAFLLLISLAVRPDAADGVLPATLDAGRAWLLIVVLTVWAADSAAYLVGRTWGRGRFFNSISPSKTWSGALGGGVAAVLAGALLGGLVGRPLVGGALGALVAVGAPLGDLAESALKRAAGVKDSGRLFPGHGGMLDRIDGFLFVAPLAWLLMVVAGLA